VWNGWIVYSPLVLFSLAGIFIGIYKKQSNPWLVLFILTLCTYLFASWWAWWFGGAFGHRCYVDYYPFLILFFCAFLQEMAGKKMPYKILVSLVIILFAYYNVAMTNLYQHTNPWDGDGFTWNTYLNHVKEIFF
jgi:hypothetical protein